jgi:hypothetical protein
VHESPTYRDVGHCQPVGSAQQIRAYPGQTDTGQALARAGPDIIPEAFLQPTYADPGNLGHIARRPWSGWFVMHLIEHPFDDALPRVEHRLRHQRRETQGPHKQPPTTYLRQNFYLATSGVFRTSTLLDTLLEVGAPSPVLSRLPV